MSSLNAIPISEGYNQRVKPGLIGISPAWTKLKKSKLLPHEFGKYGIKGGLLGGSPTWNEKSNENSQKTENRECVTNEDNDISKPSTSAKSPTLHYSMEEDGDSRDSSVFSVFPSKLCLKQKSPSPGSPTEFDNSEFQTCGTPKTSEDSMELPMYKDVPLNASCKIEGNTSEDSMEPVYKDVPLMESCKSEENSLSIGDFSSTVETGEMSIPLDIEGNGLHLELDSNDVRSDDLLNDCLVSSDLLVLNVNEEQDSIMDETKYIPPDPVVTPLRTTSVVQTTVTISNKNSDIKSEEESVHSVISTHAFHSYAKIVKIENNDDSMQNTEIDSKKESDNIEAIEDVKITQLEDNLQEMKPVSTSVVTSVPARTTTVLQMTSSAVQGTSKETPAPGSLPSPSYTENFHSYVKKLPKIDDNDVTNEELKLEKDKQLFDETLMRMKTENITETKESEKIEEKYESVGSTISSSVISKDTKLISVAHSTSQIQSKDSSPQPVISMFPPRVRPSDDSQNVLLKQLLQNSANTSITHSTMTQHVTKPPPSPNKSPPSDAVPQTDSVEMSIEPNVQYTSQVAVPTVIKQETDVNNYKEITTTPGQVITPTSTMNPMQVEIKKESVPDELISPQTKIIDADVPNSFGDSSTSTLDAQELKKFKRRQYQAKRRQSQSKDHNAAIPKKRTRKISKMDEDYDSFVDALMAQLRQLPPLLITEPLLIHNYSVCLPFGAGDPTKISLKNWVNGELTGSFGSFALPGHDDFYNTDPYGDDEPLSPSIVPPTTRGFYNEEFSPLNLEADYEDRRLELARMDRELDTPDSVMSSSSPECIIPHTPARFAGLRLIDESGSGVDSEEDEKLLKRISPVIPLVVPLALRPRVQYDSLIQDKENYGKSAFSLKSRHSPCMPLKDTANLSVTLTLSSQAAQDIVGVLKNLATVLNIAPPASYKITDRVPTPNKINPFGNKYNDDIEEVEIQKYLDGSVKLCQHCKKRINDCASVTKKASEVPFIVQDGVSDDLLFCSTSCYLQMILLVPPVISEHKVSSSDDSVYEISPRKKLKLDRLNERGDISEVSQVYKVTDASSGKDISFVEKTSLTPESTTKTDNFNDKKPLKGVKYRIWSADSIPPPVHKYKTPSEKEITETLFRMGITVVPNKMPDEIRTCIFCQQVGDGVANGPSRLLNYDVDKWAHLNCSLWSDGVYETKNGALVNVDTALKQGLDVTCTYCKRNGATLKCFKLRCSKVYHLSCAMKSGCCFLENKSIFCEEHLSKAENNRVLTTLAVYRRVYIDRDENRQIASVIKHAELTHLMRIGSLIFLNVGQLLPHQLQEFHTANFIYPVGYKVIRFYWSMRIFNKRCQYVCTIHDVAGRPEFRVLVQEAGQDDLELRGTSPKAVWTRILEPLANLRKINDSVQLFPRYVTGEDLFGLTEPAIVRILENLPGIETLSDYRFKYGRNPLLELPLAVNPSGCARCEPRVRGPPLKRTHTQRTSSVMPRPVLTSSPLFMGDVSCPYSKHFVHSKSSQYKKMKQEWRNYVYLARSKIQGLGLYAARDIDKHTMVIEYIGEIIRSQLSDFREKQYEAKNRGVYMFRLDENRVVDATICGGLARYINHSCNPNCVTEKVEVDREYRIIIFSKRRIARGEELSYDYQFDIEDDMHKIPCLCGASNCRKWMN